MNGGKPQTFDLIEKLKEKVFINPMKTSFSITNSNFDMQEGERASLLDSKY
jgi:hypothetical protein